MTSVFSRRTPVCAALGLLLLLGGCTAKPADDAEPEPIALVTLGQASTGGVAETTSVYGITETGDGGTLTLSAPSEAVVSAIQASAGTPVKAGQVVVTLLPTTAAKQDFVKATSDAAAADAAYARAKRLRADNLNSDADVETAAAAAKAADAAAAAANANMDNLALRAPESGFVATIAQHPGDVVASGTAIVTLSSLGGLRARFGIDPGLASHIALGATLHITRANGPAFDAHVLSVSPVVDPQSHLAPVIANLPAGTGLGSGEALRADLTIATTGSALTVPYAALLDDGGQPYVFVVKDGVAHRIDVTIGTQSGDRIAVAGGLGDGDQVVVQGGTALDDGMKVRLK